MSNWIDVPNLKPGDVVKTPKHDRVEIEMVRKLPTGDYEITYKSRWGYGVITTLSVTSLEVAK